MKEKAIDKLLYRIPEACQLLGIGRSLLYEEVQRGRIRPTRVAGRAVRIAAADLQRYVEMLRQESLDEPGR